MNAIDSPCFDALLEGDQRLFRSVFLAAGGKLAEAARQIEPIRRLMGREEGAARLAKTVVAILLKAGQWEAAGWLARDLVLHFPEDLQARYLAALTIVASQQRREQDVEGVADGTGQSG